MFLHIWRRCIPYRRHRQRHHHHQHFIVIAATIILIPILIFIFFRSLPDFLVPFPFPFPSLSPPHHPSSLTYKRGCGVITHKFSGFFSAMLDSCSFNSNLRLPGVLFINMFKTVHRVRNKIIVYIKEKYNQWKEIYNLLLPVSLTPSSYTFLYSLLLCD